MSLTVNFNSKKLFFLILVIQFIFTGMLIYQYFGFKFPNLIIQIIGFVYLTFAPGFFIFKILRIERVNLIEIILYSVGISISFLMFVGLLINSLYPLFGIVKPLTPIILSLTILTITYILTLFAYILNKNENSDLIIKIDKSKLVLILIPFFSIIGSFLVNYYEIHSMLFLLLILISIFPLLVIFIDWPKKDSYPLLIFVLSLSLLFQWSLISLYLTGSDVHYEYYFASLVKNNNLWDFQINSNINAMLSVVILAPIYSNILNLDLTNLFKVIYPLIYALVPVALYQVFSRQIDKKIAFLSIFYFISINPFYAEMVQLARQEIAELFLALLILLMVDNKLDNIKKSILIVIFGFSLIISHYGLSYVYMILLIFVIVLMFLGKLDIIKLKILNFNDFLKSNFVTLNFMFLFFVFAIAWYMYVSNANTFTTIVSIGSHISDSIFTDFLNSQNVQSLSMLNYTYSPLHSITKYLYIISQLFIMVGLLKILFKPGNTKFNRDYILFSIASIGVLVLSATLPFFASSLNTTRLYHISLFFLAPFGVIGFITILKYLRTLLKRYTHRNLYSNKFILGCFSIFLTVFFLFNSGLVYQIANDLPTSIALDDNIDFPMYNTGEMNSALWITKEKNDSIIYSDFYAKVVLNEFLPFDEVVPFHENITDKNYYLYLRTINIRNDQIDLAGRNSTVLEVNYLNLTEVTQSMNKIYTNRLSDVYQI